MNIAGFMEEDIVDSTDGICMSIWFSGCDIKCKGCHNQMYWEPKNIEKITPQFLAQKVEECYDKGIRDGITKSLSILGGEPLATFNRKDLAQALEIMKVEMPTLYIRLWTGRTKEQLLKESETDTSIGRILDCVDMVIVGPFIESLKQSLPLRGSSNQEIVYRKDYFVNPYTYNLSFLNNTEKTQL